MEWIKIERRPITEEEMEGICEEYDPELDPYYSSFIISPLPEDGQEVLISSKGGYVCADNFCRFGYRCEFEYNNIEDVVAWMPMPAPYKEGTKE